MKRKNIIGKGILILLILILFSSSVFSIGITPGRTTINFESGLEKTIPFSVINNEKKNMDVILWVEGDLAEYVTLEETLISFSSNEDAKELSYRVELPNEIEIPGEHSAEIIAREMPKEKDSSGYYVGATAAVATQLLVRVPYPGKYAEIKLNVVGGDGDNPVNFYIEVLNFGEEDISNAQAVIEVKGPTNEVIATIETDAKSILSKKRDELVGTWIPDVNPGVYHAVAILDYDGKKARAEKNFNVGDLRIDILSIETDRFRLGEIAKFDILVESKWNEQINGVYAQTLIKDDENIVADFKSASVNVPAFEQTGMTAYWDTEGVKEGEYDGSIILHYEGKTTEKKLEASIGLNSFRANLIGGRAINVGGGDGFKISNLLILLVVVLIIINMAWFMYFNKKIMK